MPIARGIKVHLDVELATLLCNGTAATHVTTSITVEPSVPGGGTLLVAVAFPDVQLHAVGSCRAAGFRSLAIAVVVVGGVRMIWRNGVEVIVDTPFRATVVKVELDVSTKHIE